MKVIDICCDACGKLLSAESDTSGTMALSTPAEALVAVAHEASSGGKVRAVINCTAKFSIVTTAADGSQGDSELCESCTRAIIAMASSALTRQCMDEAAESFFRLDTEVSSPKQVIHPYAEHGAEHHA